MSVPPVPHSSLYRRSFRLGVVLAAFAVASITLLSTPVSAQACATSSTHLSLSTGWPSVAVGVYTDLHNCSERKVRYTVERTYRSACGQVIPLNNTSVRFSGGAYLTLTGNWVVPSNTCLGDGVVTSRVLSGSTVLSTSSASLTIAVHP